MMDENSISTFITMIIYIEKVQLVQYNFTKKEIDESILQKFKMINCQDLKIFSYYFVIYLIDSGGNLPYYRN